MRRIRLLTTVLMLALLVCNVMAVETVSAEDSGQTTQQVASRGVGTISGLTFDNPNLDLSKILPLNREVRENDADAPSGGPTPSLLPHPRANKVAGSNPGFSGFNGISEYDQATAGSGIYAGTQGSLEPPDQALCVGQGYVLEGVNDALQVYKPDGSKVGSTVPLNQFYRVAPEFDPITGTSGDFLSDPKCLYDTETQRWFFTVLQSDVDPATGAFVGKPTHIFIAVSKTSSPIGDWNLFSINTTNDGTNGTPNHGNCPCLPDQPLIGADKFGFYITTNEYEWGGDFAFNGAQLYAMSKSKLAAGTLGSVVQMQAGKVAGVHSESVQPATTPPGAKFDTNLGGTEYFMSSMFAEQESKEFDNRIAVWALTNTSSLNKATPKLKLTNKVIHSEAYGGIVTTENGGTAEVNAEQKPGPTPLRDLLTSLGYTNGLEKLSSNDDRMNQVVFADGKLWSGVNTALRSADGSVRVGIAYFIIAPEVDQEDEVGVVLSVEMIKQGYISVKGNNVMYPSIGVNKNGRAVMAFTLVGPDYFPSAAYAVINTENRDDEAGGPAPVHLAKSGAGPEDGFSGYNPWNDTGVARWGDYSAAVADGDGNIWFATEYIPGGPRTVYANWGTFVGKINVNQLPDDF